MAAEPGIAEYLAEARGWDFDRAQAERRSARRAWWVAGVAAVVAIAAVGAVAALTPLKRVEPFVIRVDNATGVVDVVPGLDGPVEASQALSRHLLTQYVLTRERYVPALAETDYETVGAMQGPALNQAWAALWNRTNPESPLNVHSDGSAVLAQVTSVSFLKAGSGREDLAQVRFVLRSGDRVQRAGAALRGDAAVRVRRSVDRRSPPRREPARLQGARVSTRARSGGRTGCGSGAMRALGMLLLVVGSVASGAVVPPAGSVDPRVREVEYRDGQVVSLTGYVGYHIDLELAPGEAFVALASGDSAGVDVAAEGSHVLLKPKAARVATNLTLISSRRVYHFEYRAYEAQPPTSSAIFALRFRYADLPSGVTLVATNRAFESSEPVVGRRRHVSDESTPPARPVNADYWYCGSPWLRPSAASDDGVQTRLTFSSRGEWPAIFVMNADGSESLVNFHAEGTTAVVHRVAGKFVLRRGQLVGCVENRGYAGSGAWLANGALNPAESREVAK